MYRYTALSASMEFGQKAVVDVLIKGGANPSLGVAASGSAASSSGNSLKPRTNGSTPETSLPGSIPNGRQQQASQQPGRQQREATDYDDTASTSTNAHEPGQTVKSPHAKIVVFHIPHPDNPNDFYFFTPSDVDEDEDRGQHHHKQGSEGCGCVIS